MGYSYEDDDIIQNNINEEVINDNLISVNSNNTTEVQDNSNQELISNLMAETSKVQEMHNQNVTPVVNNAQTYGYTPANSNAQIVDNLLKNDEELELDYNNLITNDDEKYFIEFIGKNYNKITQKKFNFAAFFFGGFYLIYRKMYLVGIIWTFLNIFVTCVFPLVEVAWYVILIFILASYLICGFSANMLYLNHVGTSVLNMKIAKVKDIKSECKKKGGTSFLIALLLYLLINGIVTWIQVGSTITSLLQFF